MPIHQRLFYIYAAALVLWCAFWYLTGSYSPLP